VRFTKSTAPIFRRTGERYTGVDWDLWATLQATPDEMIEIVHLDGSPALRGTVAKLDTARRRDIEAACCRPRLVCWALPVQASLFGE
jgi:hypothetical protein